MNGSNIIVTVSLHLWRANGTENENKQEIFWISAKISLFALFIILESGARSESRTMERQGHTPRRGAFTRRAFRNNKNQMSYYTVLTRTGLVKGFQKSKLMSCQLRLNIGFFSTDIDFRCTFDKNLIKS